MPESQHLLCSIDDIPESDSKGFTHQDQSIFAVKKDGQLYLYKNVCPHMGMPLNWVPDKFLTIDKSLIQCSVHGAQFNIENGLCVAGPCQRARLRPVNFSVKDGAVYIIDSE